MQTYYVAVESVLNWCTLYCQAASSGARGGEGEGREAVAYPLPPFPLPSPPHAKDMSHLYLIVERWLWTINQRIKDKNFTHLIWPTLLIATVWTHRECVLSVIFAKAYTDNTHSVLLDCYHISNFVSVE